MAGVPKKNPDFVCVSCLASFVFVCPRSFGRLYRSTPFFDTAASSLCFWKFGPRDCQP